MLHQNIIMDGVDMGAPARFGSKFCNEGKWDNFIKPLLPEGDIFVEFGSNVGLLLSLAKKKYSKVIGIERSVKDNKIAKKYRDSLGLDYEILETLIRKDTFMPLADVTLLANFHYHQEIKEFLDILDQLKNRTRYCIIVSVEEPQRIWRAQSGQKDIEMYFKEWDLISQIKPISGDGDPHPRKMFSYLFKSPNVDRIDLDKINFECVGDRYDAMVEFANLVIKENDFDITKTKYYDLQKLGRSHKWSQEKIYNFVKGKQELILDIQKNGLLEPIIINRDFFIMDGLHRYFATKALGHNSIIARKT